MINFCLGVLTVLFTYALFSGSNQEEETEPEVKINGVSNRLIEISCQTCRKLKNHREVEPGVFKCTKCHRRIYTR